MNSLDLLLEPVASCLQPILASLEAGRNEYSLGLRRSARLTFLAALRKRLDLPLLLVVARTDQALTALDELSLWQPEIPRLLFPEPNPLFYEPAAWGEATRRERLMALTSLCGYHLPGLKPPNPAPVIIATGRALMTRTLPRRDFLKASRSLKLNQVIQPDELTRTCLALGYEMVNTVIASGQFARRGGIFDLWPPAESQPMRLEFFGNEIDALRRFDPATQRVEKASPATEPTRLLLTPAREYILGPNAPTLPEGEKHNEFHLPLLHSSSASLLDYLPHQALVLLDDRQDIAETILGLEEQAAAMRKDFVKDGVLPDDFPLPYLTWGEIDDVLASQRHIDLSMPNGLAEQLNDADGAAMLELGRQFSSGPRFGGGVKAFLQHLAERQQAKETVVIVSRQRQRLQALWAEQLPSPELPPVYFIEGSLAEGWSFQSECTSPLHLLTDGEIFGWRRPEPRRRPRPSAQAPEASYADLQIGDHVVHIEHGIGRFAGLVQRTVEGMAREYLCLEYAGDAQLFVPVHQADRLTRYVGPDNRSPTLSRLGSPEWKSVKAHVKEAVQEVAEELLELYAQRSIVQGYTFNFDTPWQQELEASFPYIETEDQTRVLAEVKADMESKRPMDRLVCGDVGYGKTEVALRAAFKAVMDGKQVAVLTPTTVLAQQHYNTFQQRLAAFPIEVEMLSRFRNPAQQRQIVERLGEGAIDIIIGTHRLFSNDVQFKDLGLLIIDEEQRFGVSHKEKLKRIRTEVDVLTLTATPIPRTLYMALSGIRDISTINTPPEERLPVITHVGPYSPKLARQAVLRELERGGQIFFVHNRVQTIGAMYMHLQQLLPEARITVAHGQMPEHELSQRMEQFSHGEVDILLSTSIIESGLDIPNANTLIVDRADTFGLAQLYQLRGRVGRGAQRAYAYFFRHNRIPPSFEGRQRLETIAENAQLGAGFSIAMRDLEMRGAGDILGMRQSGHIAAVGFHLYTSLLSEAVRRRRDSTGVDGALPPSLNLQLNAINVELPIPARLPENYIPDQSTRLGLYRRMTDLKNLSELDALGEELLERFGPLPDNVVELFFQLKVKLLAERASLVSISPENNQLALRYSEGGLPDNLSDLGDHARRGKTAIWLPMNGDWKDNLLLLLEKLQTQSP
jgi:transcription-repair coupling factor (superfamily II helicase)